MASDNEKQKRRFLGLRPRSAGGSSVSSGASGGGGEASQKRSSGSFIDRIRDSWSSAFRSEQTPDKKGQTGLLPACSTTSVQTCPSSIENPLESNTPIHSARATTSVSAELTTGHSTIADVNLDPDSSAAARIVISITSDDEVAGKAEPIQPPPLSSLWDKTLEIANRKLSENKLPLLDQNTTNLDTAGTNTARILQDLNIALADVNKRRWRYKNWHGEEVVVVETLGKVLGHIDRYAKIVDTVIQHNPDIIALVWGGIRTVMQVTLNHKEAMECLEFAIATVVEKIAICEFYASAYAGLDIPLESMSASNRLKLQEIVDSALPGLYASVIVFTVKAREYLCPSTGIQSFTNLFKGFAVEIRAFLNDILDAEQSVRRCADLALMQDVKASSGRLIQIEGFLEQLKSEISPLTKLNDILEIIQNQSNKADDDRIFNLLQLLSPLEPLKRHQDICAVRHKGTGAWLLENENFRKWQDITTEVNNVDERIFCCYGMPGAGKTMISSLVIEHLNSRLGENSTVVLYSDYRDQGNQTSVNIVGTLLYQYLTSCSSLALVPQKVVEMLEGIKKRNSKVSLANILEMLKLSLQLGKENMIVCIDALDELEPQTRRDLLATLKNDFGSATGIRYFLTGRPHVQDEVQKYLGPIDTGYEIHMKANLGDIRSYVQHKIEEDEVLNPEAMDEDLKKDILRELVQRSQGMFLLPALHITMILDDVTITKRRKALETLPTTLYATFTDVVKRIQTQRSKSQAKLGIKVLMWLHLASRPLKLLELQHALSVESDQTEFDEKNIPSEKALVDSCFGLVIVDKETGTIRFVHFTLEEYFRAHGDAVFPDCHSSAAEDCLMYLNLKELGPCESSRELWERTEKFAFLKYAALNWGDFVRKQCNNIVEHLAVKLIRRNEWVSCATQLLFEDLVLRVLKTRGSGTAPKLFSGLHMATYFGLDQIISKLSDSTSEYWDGNDEYEMTPLAWAAMAGHGSVVRLLLQRENVDLERRYRAGTNQTLLHLAAVSGHQFVVQLLLEREDVDPNIKDHEGKTALLWAAYHGHESVVQLLLEREDVDPNIKDHEGRTALLFAVYYGHEPVVRLLLEQKDVDPKIQDNGGNTALFWAAYHGHESVVRLLLERKDVDPNIQDDEGKTALLWAAYYGHESVVQLLLERENVDPNIKDDEGKTALLLAVTWRHMKCIRALAECSRVDIHAKDNEGRTACDVALSRGQMGIVSYFRSLGIGEKKE